jgi:hypothetical protein
MKKEIKIYLSLLGLLAINLFFVIFIQKSIYPIHLSPQNFFLLDLIGKNFYLPSALIYISELGNVVLLWLIGRKFFKSYQTLIPPAIYAISPWGSYLTAGGSFYIYLLFLSLVFTYSLLIIKDSTKSTGIILFLVSSLIAVYSSMFFLALIPVFIGLILIFKIIPFKNLKISIIVFIILISPLVILIGKDRATFKNVIQNQVQVFADPGIVNTVNSYQGSARKENLGILARISENKYLFSGEDLLLKYVEQFAPATSFTSQEKLLEFSFSSPIFLGFLIPFFYGIYLLLKSANARKIIFVSTFLVMPSVLSQELVNLNRLVIFMPVIIFIISYGLIKLIEQKSKKRIYVLIFVVLIILQMFITISDIKTKEKARFNEYYGQNYEVKEL